MDMRMPGPEPEPEREPLLEWSDNKLQDGENTTVSRHTRVEATLDSIYARLLVMARRAGHAEPTEHPSERMLLAGAGAVGLDDEATDEALEMLRTVTGRRYKPGTHPLNLMDSIALARHVAELVKR